MDNENGLWIRKQKRNSVWIIKKNFQLLQIISKKRNYHHIWRKPWRKCDLFGKWIEIFKIQFKFEFLSIVGPQSIHLLSTPKPFDLSIVVQFSAVWIICLYLCSTSPGTMGRFCNHKLLLHCCNFLFLVSINKYKYLHLHTSLRRPNYIYTESI